ncbi:hypothetical protein P7C70_g5414, partial [Phenoliferia sp. Uapishka_3]
MTTTPPRDFATTISAYHQDAGRLTAMATVTMVTIRISMINVIVNLPSNGYLPQVIDFLDTHMSVIATNAQDHTEETVQAMDTLALRSVPVSSSSHTVLTSLPVSSTNELVSTVQDHPMSPKRQLLHELEVLSLARMAYQSALDDAIGGHRQIHRITRQMDHLYRSQQHRNIALPFRTRLLDLLPSIQRVRTMVYDQLVVIDSTIDFVQVFSRSPSHILQRTEALLYNRINTTPLLQIPKHELLSPHECSPSHILWRKPPPHVPFAKSFPFSLCCTNFWRRNITFPFPLLAMVFSLFPWTFCDSSLTRLTKLGHCKLTVLSLRIIDRKFPARDDPLFAWPFSPTWQRPVTMLFIPATMLQQTPFEKLLTLQQETAVAVSTTEKALLDVRIRLTLLLPQFPRNGTIKAAAGQLQKLFAATETSKALGKLVVRELLATAEQTMRDERPNSEGRHKVRTTPELSAKPSAKLAIQLSVDNIDAYFTTITELRNQLRLSSEPTVPPILEELGSLLQHLSDLRRPLQTHLEEPTSFIRHEMETQQLLDETALRTHCVHPRSPA